MEEKVTKVDLEVRLLSSLAKVFADEPLKDNAFEQGSMLSNEVYSFQVAYHYPSLPGRRKKAVHIQVKSEIASLIKVRSVDLVPSEYPCHTDCDEHVLRTTPGLYPDLLNPIGNNSIFLVPQQSRSIWITVNADKEQMKPGQYPIELSFHDSAPPEQELGKAVFHLDVIEATLPKQKLLHTEWFHTDCIATYYGLEIFSEAHWQRIDQFIKTAVNHGINMILTPLFTPPLDTAIGGERPTVQLVDVEKVGDSYRFGFDKLKRWVDMCRANGVEYFEFSHLFTQWGAKHAPKIVATENGQLKRIFG